MLAIPRITLGMPAFAGPLCSRKICSCKFFGAEVEQVDEPFFGDSRTVICFEFQDYPEPRQLNRTQLSDLYSRYESFYKVAEVIGSSEAFVRQTIKKRMLLKT